MIKQLRHIILLIVVLCRIPDAFAQVSMPDTVCIGATRTYKVNDANVPSTYTWQINGVTQTSTGNAITITWNTIGIYTLQVVEHGVNGCDGDPRVGIVYVNGPPVPNAGPDVTVCFGQPVQLNGSGGVTYFWSPPTYLSNANVFNPIATIPNAGVYKYVLSVGGIGGCTSAATDTMAITVLAPLKVFAGNDTSIAINQPLQLNAIDVNNVGFSSYLWSPPTGLSNSFIKNPIANFNFSTNSFTYTITAKNAQGCVAKDDINIKVFAAADMFVPTAFTPNGDGLNDIFKPILVGIKELKYFNVYNRYGQMVYTTNVEGRGWDGIINGTGQNTGTFVWMAQAIDYKGNTITKKGYVVLIR